MHAYDATHLDTGFVERRSQPRYGVMEEQVLMFLSRLRRIPLSAWDQCADERPDIAALADGAEPALLLTAADGDMPEELARDRAARARLLVALASIPEVTARICRRIDEELTVADRIMSPYAVDKMRESARQAACALAVRPSLSPEDFARLYAPFAGLIPLREHADAS